jgi:predicted dehydrogenase
VSAEVRVALIGAGRWSVAHHAPAVLNHPEGVLTAIAEPNAERRALVQERLGVRSFPDATALIEAGLADAVVIGSPAAAHHSAARAALEAGLHVLVEKPMTADPAEAWDLVALACARDRALVVGYTLQFTEHAARAHELVAGGEIGELQLVEVTYASGMRYLYEGTPPPTATDDPLSKPAAGTFSDPALAGGGQAASQASHAIASMLGASGARVETVSARTRSGGLHVDLVDAALLELSGGAVGVLTSTGGLGASQQQQWLVRYYGTGGLVIHDLHAGTLTLHRSDGRVEPQGALKDNYPAQAPARHLIDLALGGGPNRAPGALGAHSVDVVDAIYRSAGDDGRAMAIAPPAGRPLDTPRTS